MERYGKEQDMKKILMALLLAVLCCILVWGMADEKKHQIKNEKIEVYFGEEECYTWPFYIVDGADDMLWVEMDDWCHVLNFVYNEYFEDSQFRVEVSHKGNEVTFKRENGYYMIMDFDEDTITFNDYNGFMHDSSESSLLDILSSSGFSADGDAEMFRRVPLSSYDRYGDIKILNLKTYGIEMIAQDGGFFVPLQTMNDFTIAPKTLTNFMYNGKDLFMATQSMIGDAIHGYTEYGEHYYSAEPREKSQMLADYGYKELCLLLDERYGLKEIHDITGFDQLFWQIGFDEGLRSLDSMESDLALTTFIEYFLDDVHSSFENKSWMTGDEFKDEAYGPSRKMSDDSDKRLQNLRSQYWGDDIYYYQEVGNTAYITFDSFDNDGPSSYYEIQNMEEMPNDTVGIIIYAHNQIYRENSPIENVVLDLSINSGGAVDAAIFTMSWFLGEAHLSMKDVSTGALSNMVYHADVNLDRAFDEKDTVTDKKLYCIISPSSFSCGNLIPAACKYSGVVTLLGRTSGGGSCVVQPATTAWGTMFTFSSPRRLSFLKNGSFYDIDQGVEPDFVIDDMSMIYDRKALTEYINKLF